MNIFALNVSNMLLVSLPASVDAPLGEGVVLVDKPSTKRNAHVFDMRIDLPS
jgi:hypothetical protein